MDKNNEKPVAHGSMETSEEPCATAATAYMCSIAYESELAVTTVRLFPSIEAHKAGCSCGEWGSVEVDVRFVRYIKSAKTEQKETEREHQRRNLAVVVDRIRTLQQMLPTPLIELPGAKGCELVGYWLERHEHNPNGHALFWALDTLQRLGDVNLCSEEFWRALVRAGQELSEKWSVEARNAKA